MIKLDVIGDSDQHFLLSADEPVRVEVSFAPTGGIVAEIYQGTAIDTDQEPVGCFDGTMIGNTSWVVG